MNIKEMQALCERLLREGVNPLTPITIISKEACAEGDGEGFTVEFEERCVLEEIDDAGLVMSSFSPDGSPKMAGMMPITGPSLMLTSVSTSGENIEGFVKHLSLPNLPNFHSVCGRSERVYPPEEFVLEKPTFNGLPLREEPVTRKWLLDELRKRFSTKIMPSARREDVHITEPTHVEWISDSIGTPNGVRWWVELFTGLYVEQQKSDAPVWAFIEGHSHYYLINLKEDRVYVATQSGNQWVEWVDEKDKVAEHVGSLTDIIDYHF